MEGPMEEQPLDIEPFDRIQVVGRGTVFLVVWPGPGDEDGPGPGSRIRVDGRLYLVTGIEMQLPFRSLRGGDNVGLLVREITEP